MDCGASLGYSAHEISIYAEVFCIHCAHSHAQVANWMMPTGCNYGTNGLYEVQDSGYAMQMKMQFSKGWNYQDMKLEQYRIAKSK